jgi:LysM repeat protein/ABC-type branched-subunit amino acid transport system substrate-binding protein
LKIKNTYSNILLLFVILLFQYHIIYTQEQPVEVVRSSEKVIIGGRLFYIHTVREGQTVYSISRAYGVTEQDIVNENSGILINLIKPGQAIKIPIIKKTEASITFQDKPDKNDFHFHKVRRGQTIYFLSRKYNVPVDIIYKFNPEVKSGIKARQIVKIPKRNTLDRLLTDPDFDEKFIFYRVNADDTLYNISKRYGVPLSEIINYNEDLRWGLKAGRIIKIPRPEMLYPDSLQLITDSFNIYLQKYIYPLTEYECDTISGLKDSIRVALLLPFFSRLLAEMHMYENDTSLIESEWYYKSIKRKVSSGANFIEFYEGALLALDSLRNTGLSVKLMVRDTERDTNTVKNIIAELESFHPDIIIGPVYTENVRLVADFAVKNRIYIVSPLSVRTELVENNPFLFQVIPSRKTELGIWADYISRHYDKNIILVHDRDSVTMKEIDYFREKLFSNFYADSTFKYIIYKEVRYNDSLGENILKALSEDRKNLVFIESTDEAYVIGAVNNLSQYQKEDYNIRLYGNPVWQTWRNIDMEYLHDLNLILHTPFYIDYKNKHTRNFIRKCRRIYNHEPYIINNKGYNYSFLGYDITFYFLTALKEYGRGFPRCIDYFDVDLLLSEYVFKRMNKMSGFENISVSFLYYNNDLTINKIKQ